jgi:ABC-type branched-subunit amino acid transport system substrate-binding protein
MEALAAARPDAATSVAAMIAREGGVVARSLELAVVTTRLEPRLADRLVQRATTHRGVSLVWVDAASFAARPTSRERELARLQAAGCAVAVVRRGDDLRTVLGAPRLERVAHG